MTALLQYPEFLGAFLLALFFFFGQSSEGEGIRYPSWLSSTATIILKQFPSSYLAWINQSLTYADKRSKLAFADFASSKLSLLALGLFTSAIAPISIVIAVAVITFFLPDLFLSISIKRRQAQIRKALPQALDLMVLCVDAGLGLDATLQRISLEGSAMPTALNDELKMLGREILLGIDREKAYQDLYLRTGVDELKTLGSALCQASKLGLSISKILRAQSEFIAKKHSQNAEEKAMKMPVYMAFPLWFFIMPSLMLLVLGPSLLRFYHQLHPGSAGLLGG